MNRIGIPTPEAALADVVWSEAALSATGTPVAGLPPPVRIENLAVAAERPVNICDVVEPTGAWDEHKYESEDEDADSVITAAMRRAAEAEKIMIEKHVAAAQRAEATKRAALKKRAKLERRRAFRQRIAVEMEAVAAKRDGLRRDKETHRARLRLVVGQLQAEAQRRVAAATQRARQEMATEWRQVMRELVTAPFTAEGNGTPVYIPISFAELDRECRMEQVRESPVRVERAMVGQEKKAAPVRREPSVMPAGVSVIGYVDDVAVLGRRGVEPRHTRGVWDVRPPRPGRTRPMVRGQRMGRQPRRRGRPPRHNAEDPMGPDYLRGVLAACRVAGMLARLDLGEQLATLR